jgi:hypothetical protein
MFIPFPKYPTKIIYELSSMYTFGIGDNYKVKCTVGTGYANATNGIIKSFTVEQLSTKIKISAIGNPTPTPGTSTLIFKLGATPPIILDTTPPTSSSIISSSYTITLSGADSGSGLKNIQYCVDNGTWMVYISPLVLSGTHSIKYYAIDMANNVGITKTIYVG